ncbi:hypothetical protein GH810_14455 [Acetobacterium paludosum]|uniref:Uncharacterized protein n=1 Tax=Acetobacterium paludosum TaxID=52693 RepID=A0A923HYJ7_9FIRM|nr:hypothetical protein [Acetobacterium paludosum]MBC3889512.1 hypothetical protein [Acetobacterium paludosum]
MIGPKMPGMVMATLTRTSRAEGHYDYENGGIWVDGAPTEISFKGAVLPLSYKDLKYDSGGTYTVDDRKLYTYNSFDTGEKINHGGTPYTILEDKDYSQFGGGLHVYIIKRGDS